MSLLRLAVAMTAIAAAPAAAVTYTVVPLQAANGAAIVAGGLGTDGTVLGQTLDSLRPVVRRPDGTVEELPTLGGSRGSARAINAAGTIVGGSRAGSNGASNRPFLRTVDGTLTALPLPAGGTIGFAEAINDAGVVVGTYNDARNVQQAFRWTAAAGTTTYARPAGFGGAFVTDFNASGVATGIAFDPTGNQEVGVRWAADGSATALTGTLLTSVAGGINDAGTVVGASRAAPAGTAFVGRTRGTIWLADGTVIDAGVFGDDFSAELSDIDTAGTAWGTSYKLDDLGFQFETRLVRWTLASGLEDVRVDFDDAGLLAFSVVAINDSGQLVLQGFARDGDLRAVLLSPAVPEPASWAMLIAGFGMTGLAMRRRGPAATVTG